MTKEPELVATPPIVILNLFQDDNPPSHVILKQVQDDGERGSALNF